MPFCTQCGTMLDDDACFCPECGAQACYEEQEQIDIIAVFDDKIKSGNFSDLEDCTLFLETLTNDQLSVLNKYRKDKEIKMRDEFNRIFSQRNPYFELDSSFLSTLAFYCTDHNRAEKYLALKDVISGEISKMSDIISVFTDAENEYGRLNESALDVLIRGVKDTNASNFDSEYQCFESRSGFNKYKFSYSKAVKYLWFFVTKKPMDKERAEKAMSIVDYYSAYRIENKEYYNFASVIASVEITNNDRDCEKKRLDKVIDYCLMTNNRNTNVNEALSLYYDRCLIHMASMMKYYGYEYEELIALNSIKHPLTKLLKERYEHLKSIYCINCGLRIDSDASFCSRCGRKTGNALPSDLRILDLSYDSYLGEVQNYSTNGNSFSTVLNGSDISEITQSNNNNDSVLSEVRPLLTANTSVFKSQENGISIFTPPTESAPSFNPIENDIPIFSPPSSDDIPRFVPPSRSSGNCSGPFCYHHSNYPAVAKCARCGKNVCQDCAEAYTVTDGEYSNSVLCYDCCQSIVAENVELLKKQKNSIIVTFAVTLVGMLIGLGLFSDSGSGIITIFGMLWMGSFWTWLKNSVLSWWNNPKGRSMEGFFGACIGSAFIAPILTIRKIIDCIRYLNQTSHAIEDDSNALQQMRDYMEYTLLVSTNEGVDLDTLMNQNSQLRSNSYAQTIRNQGEEVADAMLRRCTTTIAENGEIIRNFAA